MGDARPLSGGLAALLMRDDLLFGEAAHRRWLLSLPPFRPPAGHPLNGAALAIAPEPLERPGSVLLAGEHRGVGCLFLIEPDARPDQVIPFRGEAQQQLALAQLLVPRALPALVAPRALDCPSVGARRAVLETTDPGALDGASFGLSFGLALASSLLDEPVPADVTALARLSTEGRCESVGRLHEKLDVLHRWALGVRRVLVAPDQEEEARRIVESLGADLAVTPVDDLSAALREAFGDVEETLRHRWEQEPERAVRAARELLSLARDGRHHLLDWRAVARAASGLAHQLDDGEARWMAQLAEHIANRHRDAPTPIELREDWLRAQPRPFRLRLWAHLVQSAADGMDEWHGLLEVAHGELAPPGDEHPEDLALCAALGRAHASWYDYGLAVPLLERAARGWLALEAPHQATYAVSELLRIAGATGDDALLARVEAQYLVPIEDDPRTDANGLGFVRVNAARAHLLLGARREAARALEALRLGPSTSAHLRAAHLRWLALAVDEGGEKARLREELEQRHAGTDGAVVVELSRLDGALEAGRGLEELERVNRHPLLGREVARIRARLTGSEVAELLARHSRY